MPLTKNICRQSKSLLSCSSSVLAMTAILSIGGQAFAQQNTATHDSVGLFDEIIVTAQKRSQNSQEVPLAVTAITGDTLEKLGVTDVRGIANIVPGFTVAQSFRGPPIYTLRGVGFNTPNLAASSPVGVYVDEFVFAYPSMTDGLAFDLERVEVLKGPQGTLYGRNTTGGLVNSITRKPTQESEGYVRVNVGNYETYGVEGAIGGPLTDDLSGRLSFKTDKSDKGWQKSITHGGRRGKVDKFAARAALTWEPSDDVDVYFTGTWTRDNSESTVGQSIAVYPKINNGVLSLTNPDWIAGLAALNVDVADITRQAFTPTNASQANWVVENIKWGGVEGGNNFTPAPLDPRMDNELLSVGLRVNWQATDDITLTSLTSYADFSKYQQVDIAGWDIENAIGLGIGSIKSFNQELRLSGKTDKADWIVGGFYGRDKLKDEDRSWGATLSAVSGALRPIGVAFVAANGGTIAEQEDVLWGFRDWANQVEQDVETWSVFAQGDYDVTAKFGVTLGLRYTEDETVSAGCSVDQGDNSIAATWNAFFPAIGIPSNIAPGGCVTYLDDIIPAFISRLDADPSNDLIYPEQGIVNKSIAENNVSGRIGVHYQHSEDLLVYASASRGFKSGGIPNQDTNVGSQSDPVKQEELRAYEIGFKSRPNATSLLNASAFYYDYRDKQVFGAVRDIIYGYLTRLVNIPKSKIYGAELEASTELFDDFNVRVIGTYLKSEIKEFTGFDAVGNVRDFSGTGFTFTPELQLNAIATYRFDVSDNWDSRITLNGSYSSSQKADLADNPLFKIDSSIVFDLNMNFSSNDGKYEFEIYGKNLFDEYSWSSVQTNQDSITRFANKPRTFGAALRVNF
ncbi:hypothetical protein COB64_01020 [Candidatus Wolfebacteria bacterium]|nr:MAG: hypothetical protein COB64_01020 [Candidatus Wolfebacteria bacterium]